MDMNTKQPVYTSDANGTNGVIGPQESINYLIDWKSTQAGEYYIELEDLDVQGNTVKFNFDHPVTFTVN